MFCNSLFDFTYVVCVAPPSLAPPFGYHELDTPFWQRRFKWAPQEIYVIKRNVKKPTWRPKSGHNDKYKTTAAQLFHKTSLRELMPIFPFVSPKPLCSEPHHTLCCSVVAVVCCYHLVGVDRKSLKDETALYVDVLQELGRYTIG